MPESELWPGARLVNLARDNATDVGQSQQDTETGSAFAVGSAVYGYPRTITEFLVLLPYTQGGSL